MVAASTLPPRSAARIISSAACCQEPRSWIWTGSFRMKVRTSASVASVVPSLNTIVRVSCADQPLPEVFAIGDSPSAAADCGDQYGRTSAPIRPQAVRASLAAVGIRHPIITPSTAKPRPIAVARRGRWCVISGRATRFYGAEQFPPKVRGAAARKQFRHDSRPERLCGGWSKNFSWGAQDKHALICSVLRPDALASVGFSGHEGNLGITSSWTSTPQPAEHKSDRGAIPDDVLSPDRAEAPTLRG
jgi:hypothetical protein